MRGQAGQTLANWAVACHTNARTVLVVTGLLLVAAVVVNLALGRINSDLSTLIKPSASLAWYTENEYFKAQLPLLQGTAVVVVSGPASGDVTTATRRLADALASSGRFDAVFAPGVHPFIEERLALQLTGDQLEDWLRGVGMSYGFLLRLADGAGLANFAIMFADHAAARHNLPMPEAMATLAASLNSNEPDDIAFRGYPRLVDPDLSTHYQLIVINATPRHDVSLPNATIISDIRSVLNATPLPQGVATRLTGEVMLADEEIGAALSGVGLAGGVSLILLAIILSVGIRSPRVIASIFALLLAGVTLTMAFASLVIGAYNTLSLIFVVMFFGLGVDFAVHFALRVREAGGSDSPFQVALADIGPALVLCMATSMIAFLSFAPTDYRGLAELGIISAGGMAIAFLLTVTLLPALMGDITREQAETAVLDHAPGAAGLPALPVLLITLVLVLIAALFARDLRFDYSVLAMRDQGTEGMATLIELQDNEIATDYSISVLVKEETGAIQLREALLALPEVGAVTSALDLVPPDQAEKIAAMANQLALVSELEVLSETADPDLEAGAKLYLNESRADFDARESAIADSLNALLEADNIAALNAGIERALLDEIDALGRLLAPPAYTFNDLPPAFRDRFLTEAGELHLLVQPSAPLTSREATSRFIESVSDIAPNIAGRSVVEWGVGSVVVESFVQAVTIALALILLLLYGYFRHPWLPLLVLVPIGLALLFTAAICVLTGLTLNMANILVVPLILGLGVDTGIHVVHRFTHAGSVAAVFRSSTARATIISALTTIGTFVSLSFSPHKGAASVGLLLAIAISLMLLFTFLVLPALLSLTGYGRQETPPPPR